MILNVFFHKIQVNKYIKILVEKERNDWYVDLWFGLPGTLESLDLLAREFFDAASSNDETNQKSLLEKAREQVKNLLDKKEQKR